MSYVLLLSGVKISEVLDLVIHSRISWTTLELNLGSDYCLFSHSAIFLKEGKYDYPLFDFCFNFSLSDHTRTLVLVRAKAGYISGIFIAI